MSHTLKTLFVLLIAVSFVSCGKDKKDTRSAKAAKKAKAELARERAEKEAVIIQLNETNKQVIAVQEVLKEQQRRTEVVEENNANLTAENEEKDKAIEKLILLQNAEEEKLKSEIEEVSTEKNEQTAQTEEITLIASTLKDLNEQMLILNELGGEFELSQVEESMHIAEFGFDNPLDKLKNLDVYRKFNDRNRMEKRRQLIIERAEALVKVDSTLDALLTLSIDEDLHKILTSKKAAISEYVARYTQSATTIVLRAEWKDVIQDLKDQDCWVKAKRDNVDSIIKCYRLKRADKSKILEALTDLEPIVAAIKENNPGSPEGEIQPSIDFLKTQIGTVE